MSDLDQTVEEAGAAALAGIFGDFEHEPEFLQDDAGASSDGDTSGASADADQPRGADGRFLPKTESSEDGESPEGFTEEVPDSTDDAVSGPETPEEAPEDASDDADDAVSDDADDAVSDDEIVLDADTLGIADDHILFTKYGGDLGKALEALSEGQSTIGRLGTELGELRELRTQVDSLRELMTLQQQAASVDWDEAIASNPEQAVMMAVQYQNLEAFDQALEAWAAEEPIKAFTFLQDIQNQAAAPSPTTLDAEMEALKARHPDIQQRLPAIQAEAEKRPALARLLNDEDPRTRAQALEDLYVLSRSQETPDTSKAARRIILQAKAEADAAKADATVVSATRSAPPAPPAKSGDEALRDVLQEHLGLGDDFKIVG